VPAVLDVANAVPRPCEPVQYASLAIVDVNTNTEDVAEKNTLMTDCFRIEWAHNRREGEDFFRPIKLAGPYSRPFLEQIKRLHEDDGANAIDPSLLRHNAIDCKLSAPQEARFYPEMEFMHANDQVTNPFRSQIVRVYVFCRYSPTDDTDEKMHDANTQHFVYLQAVAAAGVLQQDGAPVIAPVPLSGAGTATSTDFMFNRRFRNDSNSMYHTLVAITIEEQHLSKARQTDPDVPIIISLIASADQGALSADNDALSELLSGSVGTVCGVISAAALGYTFFGLILRGKLRIYNLWAIVSSQNMIRSLYNHDLLARSETAAFAQYPPNEVARDLRHHHYGMIVVEAKIKLLAVEARQAFSVADEASSLAVDDDDLSSAARLLEIEVLRLEKVATDMSDRVSRPVPYVLRPIETDGPPSPPLQNSSLQLLAPLSPITEDALLLASLAAEEVASKIHGMNIFRGSKLLDRTLSIHENSEDRASFFNDAQRDQLALLEEYTTRGYGPDWNNGEEHIVVAMISNLPPADKKLAVKGKKGDVDNFASCSPCAILLREGIEVNQDVFGTLLNLMQLFHNNGDNTSTLDRVGTMSILPSTLNNELIAIDTNDVEMRQCRFLKMDGAPVGKVARTVWIRARLSQMGILDDNNNLLLTTHNPHPEEGAIATRCMYTKKFDETVDLLWYIQNGFSIQQQ